jgi:histidinol-phosphatase (PHP family)
MTDSATPLLYDSHMHTPLCKHAVGEPAEYAATAVAGQLRGIIFTCHNPLPRGISASVRMTEAQWPQYLAGVQAARQEFAGRLDVRLGLECDYMPGFELEHFLRQQAECEPFDYLLGSIHPHIRDYKQVHWAGDPVAYQKLYFEHLALTAELGLYDCLAHPDLVKNVTAEHWRVDRIIDHICRCLDRIAAAGTAMELNTSGYNKTIAEQNPARPILQAMAERHIPVVLGSDSHEPGRVGERFADGLRLLQQIGFTHVSHYLARRRIDVPIDQALASLPEPSEAAVPAEGSQS